jgi:uncharacterized protein with PQ loop repeat
MIELIGIVGAIALALCPLPQAVETVKLKSIAGLSKTFLVLWLVGEVTTLVYVLGTTADPILLANYIVNLTCLGVILSYWRNDEKT